MGVAQLGVAIPNFWFALILIYIFAVAAPLPCRRAAFPAGAPEPGRR